MPTADCEQPMSGTAPFLSGGGEMGALMRAHDWRATPLGDPHGWPVLLKNTLRQLLGSNHPMFIWWGPELIQFYNDAYRATMDAARHPAALGGRGRDTWGDAWPIIGPQIEQVMAGGPATWHEEQLVPLLRDGVLSEVWWTYGFSPIEDDGGVRGVLVICNDVTEKHRNRLALQALNLRLASEVAERRRAEQALAAAKSRSEAALAVSEDALARQLGDWQRLHAMSARLLDAGSLAEQFDIVLRTVTALHGVEKGAIAVYDPAQGGLLGMASQNMGPAGQDAVRLVLPGAGASGAAFSERRRVLVADTALDPGYEQYREVTRREGIRAMCATPFFGADGAPLGVISVYFPEPRLPTERELQLTDICTRHLAPLVERERTRAQLHREQERSHHILQTLQDGFVLLDRDFRILQINAAGLAMDGRPASEIVGRSHWDAWPGSEHAPVGRLYQRVMRERVPVDAPIATTQDGRTHWFSVHAYPYEDGIAVLYRDVTRLRQAESELEEVSRASEQRRRLYETFLSNTPDLAYVFDLQHRFTYANEVLLQMWGRTWDDAIGKNCLELGYEPWHAEMHGREIDQVRDTRAPIKGTVPFNGTFGRRMYEYIFVPVFGPDGEVEAVAGTTRDVTERLQSEEQLRQATVDLFEANARKTRFLATLAHELRNPLAPLRTGLDLMQLPGGSPEVLARARAMMDRQLRQMVHLIDDLMDIARIDSGKIELKRQQVALRQVATTAIEGVMPMVEAAGHTLDLDLPEAPLWLDADPTRLAQVLANLLTNACKYTPPGGRIGITARVEDGEVVVVVRDSGIGIPAEAIDGVFEMFSQVSQNIGRAQGGLGIGLALVRSLVQMHGGSVQAASPGEGQGSSFTLRLPLAQQAAPGVPAASRAPAAAPTLQILLADDNVDAATMLAALLGARGHRVALAHDGAAALALARAGHFDLLIFDIGMPGMSGYELARAVRALPHLADAVLAAHTGWGTEQDRSAALAAGFDAHLTKPAGLEDIDVLLARLAGGASA